MNSDDLISDAERSVNDIIYKTRFAADKNDKDFLGSTVHENTIEHDLTHHLTAIYRARFVAQKAYFLIKHER